MRIRISKRFLGLVALIAVLVGVGLVGWRFVGAARAQDEAVQAAEQAVTAMLTLDYRDLDSWEARAKSLCSEMGWTFWEIAMLQGLGDDLEAAEAVVEEVKVLNTKAEEYSQHGPLDPPGPYRLVTLDLELRFQDGHVEQLTFQAVMVYDDLRDQWLFHGPPFGTGG
jgi:hypothetical protein